MKIAWIKLIHSNETLYTFYGTSVPRKDEYIEFGDKKYQVATVIYQISEDGFANVIVHLNLWE